MKKQAGKRTKKHGRPEGSTFGLPPGSLVHVGEKSDEAVEMSIISYNHEHAEFHDVKNPNEISIPNGNRVNWLNIDGVHDEELLTRIAGKFDIHHLVMEDIMNTRQRPKLEMTEERAFIVLKMISTSSDGEVSFEQVSILFDKNLVITFQEHQGDVFDPVRQRIRHALGHVRSMGADYLAYALMDVVVDQYYSTLEILGEKLEDLEQSMPEDNNASFIGRINRLRQDIILIRKSVWPLREVVNTLGREYGTVLSKALQPYIRDLYDHIVTIIDNIETYRDMSTGMMDVYLSNVSIRMNEVMKVLTIIATIFIPLTFIVGVYGMNFHYMPELSIRWAYPAIWGVMILIVAGMLWFFKRKKWF